MASERLAQLIEHAKKAVDDAYLNNSKITPTVKSDSWLFR